MKKPKKQVIKELASHFEEDLNKSLPFVVHSNNVISYKKYAIVKNASNNWAMHHTVSKDYINEFYLKTCALMAAKAYDASNMTRYHEIKRMDTQYWASYSDNQIYKKNIVKAKDFDRYMILLNKLEHSQEQSEQYKNEISTMFKWTFV
jgi:hypothetical protein